jgi:DNA mismatch repair protein MSH5
MHTYICVCVCVCSEWFLRPVTSFSTINERLDAISFLVASDNLEFTAALSDCTKHIADLPRILARIRTINSSVGDWASLSKSLLYALHIREIVRRAPSNQVKILQNVVQTFDQSLETLVELLGRSIDFEESASEKRLVPKAGLSSELDDLRATYAGLDSLLVCSKHMRAHGKHT